VGAAGCAAGTPIGGDCVSGADCESGACNGGVCVDEGAGGAGAGGSAGEGGAGATTGSTGETSSAGGGSGVCSPNGDGTVTREEVPLAAGLQAKFRVASNVMFDTAGADVAGTTTWDLSTMFAGDKSTLLETQPLAGQWFEPLFPGASYASRLTDSADVLGVFEITGDALLLRGVVSPTDGVTRTELAYEPPVKVLAFPLTAGAAWSTTSTVTGLLNGVYGVLYETYDAKVDARGDAITPFATFDVLRVGTSLTRTAGALVTTQRTYAFVAECFGTVAVLRSNVNELGTEFSSVAEVQRLTP
jgi:hypothetical protein